MKLGLIEFVAMAMTSRASFAAPEALAASILFHDSCSFSEKHDVWAAGQFLVDSDTGNSITNLSLTITDDFTSNTPSVWPCSGLRQKIFVTTFRPLTAPNSYLR